MNEHTRERTTDALADLFTDLTGEAVVTTHQREGPSKAVLDDTDETAAVAVPPSANPLRDAIGDPDPEE